MGMYGVEYEFITPDPIEDLDRKLDVLHECLSAHAGGVFHSVDIVQQSDREFAVLMGVPVQSLLSDDPEDFAIEVAQAALKRGFDVADLGHLGEGPDAIQEHAAPRSFAMA